MDLREKKTMRAIHNAFLQLRKQKPLERITVKELAQLAEISKATFYLHYRDIYDLSGQLQNQVIQSILAGIPHPEQFLQDKTAFLFSLVQGFYGQQHLIDTLFSGNQAAALSTRLEEELRRFVHELVPEADPRIDMLLTYQIQGSFFVFQAYGKICPMEEIIRFLGQMSEATSEALG